MKWLALILAPLLMMSCRVMSQDKADGKTDKLAIHLDGMDLDKLLNLVSDELKVRFLYDDRILKRKVNLLSPVDIERKDLFGLLLSILEMQGFTLVKAGPPEAEVWKVVPFPAPISNPSNKGVLATVQLKDIDKLPQNEQLASLVVALQYVDARSVFIAVQGMVSDPRTVQAIESANVVVVTDTAQNLRRIGDIMKLMDQPAKVHGAPSVTLDVYLFDVAAQANAAMNPEALLKQLTATKGEAVRLLDHWSGAVLDGRTIQSMEAAKSIHLNLSMTPELPHALPPAVPAGKDGQPAPLTPRETASQPGPSDGEVALKVNLQVEQTGDPSASYDCSTTLGGKEGEWLLWTMQSAAEEGRVRVFFAKVAR